MDSVDAVVMKSGENRILTSLQRTPLSGLRVTIWARTEVEDFMRSLGTGETQDVQTLGRHWQPAGIDKQNKKLYVYELSKNIGSLSLNERVQIRFDRPGQSLTDDGGDARPFAPGPEVLNLSFLRVVGISEPGGVSFAVNGVYGREAIDRLGKYIEQATQRFYREFLKPYKLVVGVYTMPTSEGSSL